MAGSVGFGDNTISVDEQGNVTAKIDGDAGAVSLSGTVTFNREDTPPKLIIELFACPTHNLAIAF